MIYLFPTQMEAAKFRDARPDANVVICGVGAVECAATIAALQPTEMVILAGVAGSHNAELAPMGSVVEVASEQLYGLPERFSRRYFVDPQLGLKPVSSATVSRSGESDNSFVIENMEGAALFALAERLGFSCAEIRAISNMVGDEFPLWQLDHAIEALTNTLINIKGTSNYKK